MTLKSDATVQPNYSKFTNGGTVDVAGGTMAIDENVQQGTHGLTKIEQGGTLTLSGSTDGGSIDIDSGKLAFAPTQFAPYPMAGSYLHSGVRLEGDDVIEFGTTPVKDAVYRAATNDLLVSVPFKGGIVYAADIHLIGHYSQSQFSVSGSDVIFHEHPAT